MSHTLIATEESASFAATHAPLPASPEPSLHAVPSSGTSAAAYAPIPMQPMAGSSAADAADAAAAAPASPSDATAAETVSLCAGASVSGDSAVHPWLTSGLTYRLSSSRKSPEELKRLRSQGTPAKVTQFYEEQNELIDDLLTPLIVDDDNEENDDAKVTLAVRASLGINVLLFICQAVAATSSGSMALLATATDSFMDLLSGIVLVLADRAAKRQNVLDYPTVRRTLLCLVVVVGS